VPTSTTAVAADRMMLLSTMALSRLTGAKRPPAFRLGARRANRKKPAPAVIPRMLSRRIPRAGSTAKAWTLVSTPERTRKVPSSDSEKARMASRMVHTFSPSRFSITTAECSSAVPASHGMKEAFSTGSQNHQPPQPSS
jgi:hypothetical protein